MTQRFRGSLSAPRSPPASARNRPSRSDRSRSFEPSISQGDRNSSRCLTSFSVMCFPIRPETTCIAIRAHVMPKNLRIPSIDPRSTRPCRRNRCDTPRASRDGLPMVSKASRLTSSVLGTARGLLISNEQKHLILRPGTAIRFFELSNRYNASSRDTVSPSSARRWSLPDLKFRAHSVGFKNPSKRPGRQE
jgi:hypothetical protein